MTARPLGALLIVLIIGGFLAFPVGGQARSSSYPENSVSASAGSQGKLAEAKTKSVYKRKRAGWRPHRVTREAILLKDLATGQVMFERRASQVMAPASLTKIMSAILILEEANLDEPVTVSAEAASTHGTRLRLKAGEVYPLRGLVEAMLIRSANDACLAAAEHVAGDEQAFVAKMNARAKELGLTRTQFKNACGFTMEGHYSTAEDLAMLTEHAMANEVFASIVREPMAVLQTLDQSKTLIARTTNRLLGVVDGVVGVKTGYTRASGRCLITVAQRGDKTLLLVLLNARQRWNTAQTLIEWGLGAQPVLTSAAGRH